MARLRNRERLLLASALSLALHAVLVVGYLPRPGSGQLAKVAAESGPERVSIRVIEPQAVAAEKVEGAGRPPRNATQAALRATTVEPSVQSATVAVAVPGVTEPVPEPPAQIRPNRGTVYIPSAEVDVRASPLDEIVLEFPAEAGFATGYLVLQIFINELGRVDSIHVMVSDPEGLFDAAAIRAFATARFRPAVLAGATVKTEMIVEVKYEPPVTPAFVTTVQGAPAPAQ